MESLLAFLRTARGSLGDLAPIILVIALFQLLVLRQPIPDVFSLLGGLLLVVLGLIADEGRDVERAVAAGHAAQARRDQLASGASGAIVASGQSRHSPVTSR